MQHLEAKMTMRNAEREFLHRQLERTRLIYEAGLPTADPIRTLGDTMRSIGSSLIASISRIRTLQQPHKKPVPANQVTPLGVS